MVEAYKFSGAKLLAAGSLTFIGPLLQPIQLYRIFEDSSTLILLRNGRWIYFADRGTSYSAYEQFVRESLKQRFYYDSLNDKKIKKIIFNCV